MISYTEPTFDRATSLAVAVDRRRHIVAASSSAGPRARQTVQLAYTADLRYCKVRRSVDVLVSAVLLILCAPVIAVSCLLIFLEDGGPVFFTQRRVGRFERLFTIYKLRTMRTADCGDRYSPSSGRDHRITAVGYWLRKTSIDELPQLWNVLCGDMALVGPRPEMPFIVRSYEPWQRLRHLTTPGITGLWQTTCRSEVPLQSPDATRLDLEYIQTASPWTDIKLILRTALVVFRARGAY